MLKTSNRFGFRSLFPGLLPLFVLAHFAHHLLTAILVPLLPMIRSDFALDYTKSGLVVSAFNLSYGVAQLPAGWLTDRIEPRLMVTVSICGMALAGILIGLSQTYVMLIALLILMGVLGGGYHPASPAPLLASVEPKKRGQALGLHMIGGSASYFLSPLIAAAIATIWSWRGAYISLAVPTIIIGIVFYLLLGCQWAGGGVERKTASSHIETASTPDCLRRLVMLIFLAVFVQAIMSSVVSLIPLFLVDHFGISPGTAATSMSVIYSAGLWASPLGGYLSDRWGRVPVVLVACFAGGPIIYSLNLAPYGFGLGALLVAFGMVMYVYSPALQAYIIEQASERNRSMILGVYFFASLEGGGVLTPVMGYLIDHLGFYSSFSIAGAAVFIMTIVCSIFLGAARTSKCP